jgi:hypothetical protein
MMDFELKLEKANFSRAWISAATMGLSYFIGMLSYPIREAQLARLTNRQRQQAAFYP